MIRKIIVALLCAVVGIVPLYAQSKNDNADSIEELARILGGAQITELTMQSAREMKELAETAKKY